MQTKRNQVFKDIMDYFISTGLPVNKPGEHDGLRSFSSEIKQGEIILRILVVFDQVEEAVVVSAGFSHGVPRENRPAVVELLNFIHHYLDTGHYTLDQETGGVVIRDGIFVVDEKLNKKEFSRFFEKLINDAYVFFPLILDQGYSAKRPAEMIAEFLEKTKHIQK